MSIPINIGLSEGTRVSSRVLKPPGGGYSDIFGSEPEPPRRYGRRQVCDITGAAQQNSQSNDVSPSGQAKEAANDATPKEINEAVASEPAKSVASEPAMSVPSAPVKPVPSESAKTESQKPSMEPNQRVRVPPGGFSSGFW